MAVFDLHELLTKTVEMGGSDLHISVGAPPKARVHGDLTNIKGYVKRHILLCFYIVDNYYLCKIVYCDIVR